MARKLSVGRHARAVALGSVAALALCPAPALAQGPAPSQVKIEAQSLGDALTQAGRQTRTEIIFSPSAVAGKTAPEIQGNLSAQEAIARLLAGSGLTARQTKTGAFVIESPNQGNALAAVTAANPADKASSSGDDFAQNEKGIAEILVVGKKTQNVDIRRTEDDPQPYVTFDSREIESSQATNLEDFLRKRLPMNTAAESSGQTKTPSTAGNISSINLRGLGANQTLILIDGRRAPRVLTPGVDSSEFSQADINGIPLAAIDRIEILPSTAGGIYGGGAVGGVINIIRKRDYNGVDLSANYDGAFRGGAETLQLGLNGGFSVENGRTQISFTAYLSKSQPLYVADNDLWRRGRQLLARNKPGAAAFSGYVPNVSSAQVLDFPCVIATGSFDGCFFFPELTLDNGVNLGSSYTFVPDSYPGVLSAMDSGEAFLENAGKMDLRLANDTTGRFATIVDNPRINSLNLNIRRELTPRLDLYVDGTFNENLARTTTLGTTNFATVSADAPNNPFQQDVIVAFPVIGTETPLTNKSTNLAATIGSIWRVGSGWSASAEYQIAQATNETKYRQFSVREEILSDIYTGAIDVLRDLNEFPIDYGPYLVDGDDVFRRYRSVQDIASLRTSGPLFRLGSSTIQLTGLLERRIETALASREVTPASDIINPRRSQSVTSAYVELRAPIIESGDGSGFLNKLELQGSIRHDAYRTRSQSPTSVNVPSGGDAPEFSPDTSRFSSTDFTLAGLLSPIKGVDFRASYSTGFLPPSISQIVSRTSIIDFPGIFDPARGGQPIVPPVTIIQGGNPSLRPESSNSFSLGVIFTPSVISGLRLSADYTDIRKSGEIGVIGSFDYVLAHESDFPGRVVRGAPLPGDPAGIPGPITSIDVSLINIAKSKVRAIDVQADYEFGSEKVGRFHLYGVSTVTLEFRRNTLPSNPSFNSVDSSDGPLRLRLNAGLDWRKGLWELGWNTQYYGGYSLTYADPTLDSLNNAVVELQGRSHIPGQMYHDLSVSYHFSTASGILANSQIRASIQNLFDAKPPVIAAAINGYSPYGDPRLRRFSISIRKSFGGASQ